MASQSLTIMFPEDFPDTLGDETVFMTRRSARTDPAHTHSIELIDIGLNPHNPHRENSPFLKWRIALDPFDDKNAVSFEREVIAVESFSYEDEEHGRTTLSFDDGGSFETFLLDALSSRVDEVGEDLSELTASQQAERRRTRMFGGAAVLGLLVLAGLGMNHQNKDEGEDVQQETSAFEVVLVAAAGAAMAASAVVPASLARLDGYRSDVHKAQAELERLKRHKDEIESNGVAILSLQDH